jgi:hypothetical protein
MNKPRLGKILVCGALLGSFVACEGILEVQDPSRFTDSDLDQALGAVANGAEGQLHVGVDYLINNSEILGDVMAHTGTWIGWDDIDHGRINYDNDGRSDGGDFLLTTRYASQDAQLRFDRLTEEGETVDQALYAQVQAVEGWTELLLGMNYCEIPGDPVEEEVDGNMIWVPVAETSPAETYARAVTKLTTAMASAQAAGSTEHLRWATAGRARANLFLGNFGAAAADAGAIPDGWVYEALYDAGSQDNWIVSISTFGYNHASGIRDWMWPRVDDVTHLLRDAYTNETDPRIPIYHEAGVLGVDGVTEFYSQWKYIDEGEGSDIPLTHSEEMRLIEAEVLWRAGDAASLTQAVTILNNLRAAAGLTAVAATTSQEVFDLLLNERFAELFMEGQRTNDIFRFGLTTALMAAGHFTDTEDPRVVQFPMSTSEARNNPEIEDDASIRCLPLSDGTGR